MSSPAVVHFSNLGRSKQITVVSIFAVLWFLLDHVANLFLQPNILCSWYPNAGLSLGFAVYFGPVAILIEAAIRIVSTIFYWKINFNPVTLITFNLVPALLTFFISYPIRRIITWKGRVQSPKVALVFIICIVAIGFLKAGLIMLTNSLSGMMKFADFFNNLISWWSGDLIGMITVAPIIILVIGPLIIGDLEISKKPMVYFRALAFTLTIFAVIGLLHQFTPQNHYSYWHLMIPIHVVAAVVLGLRWLSIQVFVGNLTLSLLEFSHPSQVLPFEQQVFLTILSAGSLYLALLFEEKKIHEDNIKNHPHQISQSEEAEALFVNILSHELRTPLTAVIGYAEIMVQEESASLNNVGLQKIRFNTEKLINLVDRLTSFVNLQLIFKTTPKEKIDLQRLVENVFAKHDREARQKNIDLGYSADQKIELFNVPDVLFGILDELVSNSIKFTAKGAIMIKAELIKDEVHLRIGDSGIGMAQEFQPFDTFEQESKGLTREFAGLGIGLSMCRMWSESIGGKLTLVYSEKGKGTQFLLVFKTLLPD